MIARRKIWAPADYSKQEHRAVQNFVDFAEGRAEELSQDSAKRALEWILYNACQLREEPFIDPGQNDVRDYVLGRQSVARQIMKLATLKVKLGQEVDR